MLVKNGASRGRKQALCKACFSHVSLRYGTAYFGLESDISPFETAVRALAEGNSIRATARILQIDKDTVCRWLNRASQHCRLVMLFLWQQLHVIECQLDELWSFVHTKERNLSTAKLLCEDYGDAWVWIAFAPQWRLILAFVVGKRNQESANRLLQRVDHVTDTTIPFFTSDQLPEYRTALLDVYGQWHQPKRQGNVGRFPKPRLIPREELLYAQVVKHRKKGRVVKVSNNIVFGQPQQIANQLEVSPVSHVINTSFVERDNLSLRMSNRRLTRRTNAFTKEMPWLEKQLWLSLAYYHLVLPHLSLRQQLEPLIAAGNSSYKRRWHEVTPAIAAGMTNHIWSTEELLSYRIPVRFFERLPEIEVVFPPLD